MDGARQWLRTQEIEIGVRLGGKRAVLGEAARLLAARTGMPSPLILGALWHRESLGSTGLGRGVALPHARIDKLGSAVGAFMRLGPPVAFDSPDDKPVELVLALLLPNRDPQRQLDLLAAIAGKFEDPQHRQRIVQAPDPATAWQLLTAGIRG